MMKIFIWQRVNQCSYNFHSEGGVVVFSENEEKAREIANNTKGCKIEKDELPDKICDVTSNEECIFIFPDAGCC